MPIVACFLRDSASNDDTASMITGEGYEGARTRQPPTAHTKEKNSVGQGGYVLCHPDLHLDCCC
jgi:hypothetical protein